MTSAHATEPRPPAPSTSPSCSAAAAEFVLDHVGQQHLGGAHEQQVGDAGAGERAPQPDVAAHVATGPRGAAHAWRSRRLASCDLRRRRRHRPQRERGDQERGCVGEERGARSERRHQQPAERRAGEAQRERAGELLQRVRLGRAARWAGSRAGSRRWRGRRTPARRRRWRRSPSSATARAGPAVASAPSSTSRPARRRSAESITRRRFLRSLIRPAEQQQGDQRHAHRDAEQRERGGTAGDRVGLPRERDEEDAVAQQRHAAPAEQRRKSRFASGASGRAARRDLELGRAGKPCSRALGGVVRRARWRARRLGGIARGPVEEVDQRARLHRMGEVEALAELAAEVAQLAQLLVELDALGDDLERERAAERDDRAREIGGLGARRPAAGRSGPS